MSRAVPGSAVEPVITYVVGSGQNGPMGKEAIAFDKMADAKKFAATHGGKVIIFTGVTSDKIRA